jgi:hypothetical protein
MNNIIQNKNFYLKEQKGASLVEFAIILSLLITIIFGIIEFGLLLYDKGIITHAAREGARVGVVFNVGTDPTVHNRIPVIDITNKVNSYIENRLVSFTSGIQDPDIQISLCETGDPSVCTENEICPNKYVPLPLDPVTLQPPPKPKLKVQVRYTYNFLILPNFVSELGVSLDLQSEAMMVCEY